jgi:hypothetical protein
MSRSFVCCLTRTSVWRSFAASSDDAFPGAPAGIGEWWGITLCPSGQRSAPVCVNIYMQVVLSFEWKSGRRTIYFHIIDDEGAWSAVAEAERQGIEIVDTCGDRSWRAELRRSG